MKANLYPYPAIALATLVGAFTTSLTGCDQEKPNDVERVPSPVSGICEMCQSEDGQFRCCDGQGPGGGEETFTCSEFDVQGEFWRELADCNRSLPGMRCRDHCITDQCQAYDSSVDGTWSTSCPQPDQSWAWKNGIEVLGFEEAFNHTYFCLTGNWSDCYSIVGYGINSTKSGGDKVPGTGHAKSSYEVCLARYRASNDLSNACGLFSQAYGINGVCHQHTNRGQLSMHATWMNPSHIEGGWLSFGLWGPYGNVGAWSACYIASKIACRNQ